MPTDTLPVRDGHKPAGVNASFTGSGQTRLRDLRTLQDFADVARVKIDTIHAYRTRGYLPDPIGYVGITPVWSDAQVRRWLADRGTTPPAR